ncbi:MAG: hypothetical protein JSR28_21045 [Proteobacteria bacterium]|nr:hypothetical protein [Pseudomonadota bacterium]
MPSIILRIQGLLDENSEQSVTYAALEARLALEKVCYDRLRQRHDYISHAQLKKWQPGAVINTLMSEVDSHVTQTMTMSISKTPPEAGVKIEDAAWIELGTEIGFDPKLIARLWNALAKLALHARLPEHKNDHIPDYGDKAQVRTKVEEVIVELERLSKGTMTFSGVPAGGDVSFLCRCGEKNKRRMALLREGQSVSCINPNCMASWKTHKDGDTITFESDTVDVDCGQCGERNFIDRRNILKMKFDQHASFNCRDCSAINYMRWQLVLVRQADPPQS